MCTLTLEDQVEGPDGDALDRLIRLKKYTQGKPIPPPHIKTLHVVPESTRVLSFGEMPGGGYIVEVEPRVISEGDDRCLCCGRVMKRRN